MAKQSYVLLLILANFWLVQIEADSFQFSTTPNALLSSESALSEKFVNVNLSSELKISARPPNIQITIPSSSNEEENPLQCRICLICSCKGESPFLIDCNGKGLKDRFLPSEWPNNVPSNIIEAKFDSNEFIEIAQFPELPLLRLSYRKNGLIAIEQAAFKYLKVLEYLDLSENSLTHESIAANVFEGPFNEDDYEPIPLKTLKLGYNQIISIDKDAFDHLSYLETLELNNNPLKVIDHQTAIAITSLRKLKTLNLAETYLSSVPSGFFHALPALKLLVLAGNRFTVIPEELQHAIHLEYLNLNNNPIKTLDAESFQGLSQLKHLNVSSMPSLEWIDANTFTPLTSMIQLWCSFNPALKTIHPAAFSNMDETDGTFHLSEFHFRGNKIQNIPPSLLPWNSLGIIDIGENPFKCDCNIGWVVTSLVPLITDKTPDLITSLSCARPEEYKEMLLDSLATDTKIVNCTNPTDIISGGDNNHDGGSTIQTTSSNKGLIIFSLFGIISVIGGMACFIMLAVRKSNLREMYDTTSGQIVHYVRTAGGGGKQEDEQAIVQKEYNQYYEEP